MDALTDEAIQQEIDDISELCADLDQEDENSWIAQLNLLDSSNNQSLNNQSLNDSVLDELDENTKESWLYPINNYEKRDYQINISKSTLFYNTLVILPTGLGKTFISSVTIYNFMRWFPQSIIVFMTTVHDIFGPVMYYIILYNPKKAPTRPLVHQQMSACYSVVGIPKKNTTEITGIISSKKKRQELYSSKKIFFATPQAIQSDIKEGIFPCKAVKLLIFDECHKARGNYAYCKVLEEIYKVNRKFRVLGLSATAGAKQAIIELVKNLLISKIEVRTESSIDVQRYTHKKAIEVVEVKMPDDLKDIYDDFISAIDRIIKDLRDDGFIRTHLISKGYLIIQRKKFVDDSSIPYHLKSQTLQNFSEAITFYHSLEILQRHSVHLFLKSLRDDNNKTKYKFFIARDQELTQYVQNLEAKYEPTSPFQININPLPNGTIPPFPADKQIDFGHPKFEILKTKLKEYYENNGNKAIVFCEYRDTTHLIHMLLLQLRPLVMPSVLIGHGGKISQKEQLKVMKDFREGSSNTLICTSVGEEGLDIGEVDLVICFDINSKSVVRFVQRIGRTARKRNGQVIILASEGKELSMSKTLMYSKNSMNKSISRSNEIPKYFYKGVQLFPKGFNPKRIEMKFVFEDEGESEEDEKAGKKKGTKRKKKEVKLKNSKAAITNYLKPIETKLKKKADESKTEIVDEVIEIEENTEAMDCEQVDEGINNGIIVSSVKFSLNKPKSDTVLTRRSTAKTQSNLSMTQSNLPISLNTLKIPVDLNFNNIIDKFQAEMNQILEEDAIKNRPYVKNYIEYYAENEINSALSLMEKLQGPIDKIYEFDTDDLSDVEMSFEEPDLNELKKKYEHRQQLIDEKRKKIAARCEEKLAASYKSPVRDNAKTINFNSPYPANFTDLKNSSTPIRKIFSPKINSLNISKSLTNQLASPEVNFPQANNFTPLAPSESAENDLSNKKFAFLGIMSIEDIFEGCETHAEYSKISTTNTCKSPKIQDEVIESSILDDQPVQTKEVFANLRINTLDDIFGTSNDSDDRALMENSVASNSNDGSDQTQIYDVEEEFARVEESPKCDNGNVSAELFNISTESPPIISIISPKVETSPEETNLDIQDSLIKKTESKPNLSKLISDTQNGNASKKLIQKKNLVPYQDMDTQYFTPKSTQKTIRSTQSTPDILYTAMSPVNRSISSPITSKTDSQEENVRPTARRIINRRKMKLQHHGFLQTQAAVDEKIDSSDDHEDLETSLNDFVCNNETVNDQTTMFAKYIKSIQSPSAPVNNRFILRQIKPSNFSAIYSQLPDENDGLDSTDSMDSFIVEDGEDDFESEIDELELAERKLKEQRRRKRKKTRNQGENPKKRRIVMQNSETSDENEEFMRLRNESL